MTIKTIACRYGKIVIDDQIGIVPVRSGTKMQDLFPSSQFDLKDDFVSILTFIDFGNDLHERIPIPPEQYFHLAIARFEGSVSNYEITTALQNHDLIDASIPEEDILSTIAHFGSPHMNGTMLYNKPYMHNLFIYAHDNTQYYRVVVENRPRIKGEIRWYVFKDDATDAAYHISTEKLFFPIKKSALPW